MTATVSAVGTEIRVNTATANGGVVVTWGDLSLGAGGAAGDSDGTAVKAQVFAANGTPVGSELLVNTATASTQDEQQITALAGGGFVVVWKDESQGVDG